MTEDETDSIIDISSPRKRKSEAKVNRELYKAEEEDESPPSDMQLQISSSKIERVVNKRKKTMVCFSERTDNYHQVPEEANVSDNSSSNCRSRKATPFKKFSKPLP